jgi:hypothetical protein
MKIPVTPAASAVRTMVLRLPGDSMELDREPKRVPRHPNLGQENPLLPQNRTDPLGLRCECQVAVKLGREAHATHASLAKPPCELLAERIGQDRGVEENRFDGSMMFDCTGNVSNALDEVKTRSRSACGVWRERRERKRGSRE